MSEGHRRKVIFSPFHNECVVMKDGLRDCLCSSINCFLCINNFVAVGKGSSGEKPLKSKSDFMEHLFQTEFI